MQTDTEHYRQGSYSYPNLSVTEKNRDWDARSDPGQGSTIPSNGDRTPPARAKTTGYLMPRPKKLSETTPSAYRNSYADEGSVTTATESYHSMRSKPSTEFGDIDHTLTVDHTGYMLPSLDSSSAQLPNPYDDPPLLKMLLESSSNGIKYPTLGGPHRSARQTNKALSPKMPEPVVIPTIPSPAHDPTYHSSAPSSYSNHDPTHMPVPIIIQQPSPPNDDDEEEHTAYRDRTPPFRAVRPLSDSSTPPSSPPSIPLPAIPSTPSSVRNSAERSRPSTSATPRTSTDAGHGLGVSPPRGYSSRPNNGSRSRPASLNPSSSGANTLVSRVPPSPTYPPPLPPSSAAAGPSHTAAIPPKASPARPNAPLPPPSSAPSRSEKDNHGAGPSSNVARRRPTLPGQTDSSMNTRYVNMLLAVDDIPQIHNLLAGGFVWLLLAGFVLFPGTFTSLQEQQTAGIGGQVIGVISQVPL